MMFRKLTKEKNNLIRLVVVSLLVVLGLAVSSHKFQTRTLWIDELNQLNPMGISLETTMSEARRLHQFPGDYLLIYPFYQIFKMNKWGLAIPHILANLLGYYLLYRMCLLYIRSVWGYGIAFLVVALNANLTFHAFEIRPYPVLAALGMAAFLAVRLMVTEKKPGGKNKLLLSGFIFLLISYHIFGLLMLFCSYLFHLFSSRRDEAVPRVFLRNIRDYIWGVLAAFPVFYYFAISTEKTYQYETFVYISKGVIPILKSVFGNLVGYRPLYVLLLGVVLGFVLPVRDRFLQIKFFLTMIILPVVLTLIICLVNHYWFIQRLFIWVMPLFAFFLGWQWDSIICYFSGKIKKDGGALVSRVEKSRG